MVGVEMVMKNLVVVAIRVEHRQAVGGHTHATLFNSSIRNEVHLADRRLAGFHRILLVKQSRWLLASSEHILGQVDVFEIREFHGE